MTTETCDTVALHPTILREYDIRGIVGDTLTEDGVRAVGRAFGTLVRRDGGRSVVVGYDGRLHSPMLADALVEGLRSTGVQVIRIGLGPSPMLYFAAYHLKADAGMMITGSHNPPDYNGIKMVKSGKPFFADQIQLLGRMVEAGDFERGQGTVEDHDIKPAYVTRLAQDFGAAGRDLKIAWDPGNGAVGAILQDLCARIPGNHVFINEAVDGTFPAHHPDPTVVENLVQLQEAVSAHRCDLGIAFDGDGDRIGVIDGQGRVIWGDQLVVILGRAVLAEVPGATIIADVKSSKVLFDEIARMGGKPLMSRTGHSLIKTMMVETGAALAGEMSGHIFFAHKYYGFDDAPYAAVRLLDLLARADESLAQMRDAMPTMINTPELRIDCPEERKFAVIDEVKQRLGGRSDITVQDIDGVRVTTADGWWLLRASNTQPVLVGRCESESEAGLQRLRDELSRQLTASAIDPVAVSH
jgi:Phosphomannomutase